MSSTTLITSPAISITTSSFFSLLAFFSDGKSSLRGDCSFSFLSDGRSSLRDDCSSSFISLF